MKKFFNRKTASLITALVVVFSFSSANILNAYETEESNLTSVKYDYDRIEELSDGGKIYVYSIDGLEHKFPVPPDDFQPLTASDEQLETYGFPPRPDEENVEDYEEWVEIMSCYKSTAIPEVELVGKDKADIPEVVDNQINPLSASNFSVSNYGAGYSASLSEANKFFSQVQGDFTQPTITSTSGECANMFMVGFGALQGNCGISAGTRCIGNLQASAYYSCYGNSGTDRLTINSVKVNPGDKVHVYVSYQRANNIFNYYIVNMTTGTQTANVVEYDHANFYDGKKASWYVGRCRNFTHNTFFNLGKFTDIQFTNCKAMLNTSTEWTNLGDFDSLLRYDMGAEYDKPNLAHTFSITNKNQFKCTWMRYYEYY